MFTTIDQPPLGRYRPGKFRKAPCPNMFIRSAPWLFVVLWATGYIGMKLGAPYAEPMTFLSLRFLGVLLVLVPLFYLLSIPLLPVRQFGRAVLIGAFLHGVYLGAVLWAIKHGMPAGMAALIISLQPILSAVLAAYLLGDHIGWQHWLGLLLGLCGVALVIFPSLELSLPSARPEAIVAGVASLFALTFATFLQKALAAGIDVRGSLIPQYIGAALVVGSYALLFETREVVWAWDFVVALIWLILVLSIGAVSLLLVLLRHNSVWRTSALFYLIPPVTALFAWLLFGEALSVVQLCGMAIAVFAVFVARQTSHGTERAQ